MLLRRSAGNNNITQVTEADIQAGQESIHHALECVSHIPGAKQHPEGLKQPKSGDYCFFWNISRVNWDLVIAFAEVDLAEHAADCHVRGEVHHVGQRVGARNSHKIKMVKITTRTSAVILIPHRME